MESKGTEMADFRNVEARVTDGGGAMYYEKDVEDHNSIVPLNSQENNAMIACSQRGSKYSGRVDENGYPIEFQPTEYYTSKFMKNKEEYDAKKHRVNYIELPSNVWGALMILPYCQLSENSFNDKLTKIQIYLVWFVNLFVQGSLVWYVRLLYLEQVDDPEVYTCDQIENKVDVYLRNICILIYVCMVLADISETWRMHQWYQIMTPTLEWVERFTTSYEFRLVNADYETKDVDTLEIANNVTNLNAVQYYFTWIFIIGAKYILGLYVVVFGTGFVVTANDDMDVLLNAVALLFILDTDEIVYDYLIPVEMKEVYDKAPRILVKGDTELTPITIFAKCVVTVTMAYIVLRSYCGNEVFDPLPEDSME